MNASPLLESVHEQLVKGKMKVKRLRGLLQSGAIGPEDKPEGSTLKLSLLLENVLHQEVDSNTGRMECTRAFFQYGQLAWKNGAPALEQPLAWAFAGLGRLGSLQALIPESQKVLEEIFPDSLSPDERLDRWSAVETVLHFVWTHAPVRHSAPIHEFQTWWEFCACSKKDVAAGKNAAALSFYRAWERAHASDESQGRFLANAFALLDVPEAFPENDPVLAPLGWLPSSPRVGTLLSSSLPLQNAFLDRLTNPSLPRHTPKERLVDEALAFLWLAHAPEPLLVAHWEASLGIWERLKAGDAARAKKVTENNVAAALSLAALMLKNRGSSAAAMASVGANSQTVKTLMTGPFALASDRLRALAKSRTLNQGLPVASPRSPSPRF